MEAIAIPMPLWWRLLGRLYAFALRLLDFTLRRFIGESASFITGAIYVIFVLFVPYGIVGTMKLRQLSTKPGWQRLWGLLKPKN